MPGSRVASGGSPPSTAADGWVRILRRLDARRARAYADRSAAVLRSVYAAPALLRADTHTLMRLVPPGCRLVGVRTSFRQVVVRPGGTGVAVSVRAALRPSTLRCPGRPDRAVPGTAPVPLHLVIVRTADGPRIAREWRPG